MTDTNGKIRKLAPDDLDAVVDIDARLGGDSRHGYFEKRLAAALRAPDRHMQFATDDPQGLASYVLARVLADEYGRVRKTVLLETIGVDPGCRGQGLGAQLLDGLEAVARDDGIGEIETAVDWRTWVLTRFFAGQGFTKAPRHILSFDLSEGSRPFVRETDLGDEEEDETSDPVPGRIDIASLACGDLEDLVRIDGKLTRRDRRDYMAGKLDEALLDSGIRVSLLARSDGLAAGFLMARIDFGDTGRTRPTAVVDTLGVHPDFARRGIASALLAQLAINLEALRIERIETTLRAADLGLISFFTRAGFRPAERIALTKRLA